MALPGWPGKASPQRAQRAQSPRNLGVLCVLCGSIPARVGRANRISVGLYAPRRPGVVHSMETGYPLESLTLRSFTHMTLIPHAQETIPRARAPDQPKIQPITMANNPARTFNALPKKVLLGLVRNSIPMQNDDGTAPTRITNPANLESCRLALK